MSVNIDNFLDNDDVALLESGGPFQIIEYKRDLSCTPAEAQTKYYMAQMKVRPRQIVCSLNNSGVVIQAGAMQWFAGNVQQTSGVKGVGDFIKKGFAGAATKESAIKPEYAGDGVLVTEPTYRHYLVESLKNWQGAMVIQDGLFAAAENTVGMKVVARSSISSAVAGGEGLFNLCLTGNGYVVLESNVPREELIVIDLQDDQIRIDGSYAIAWSNSLKFTVERSGKSLIGSAASGEGLVNVYRGSGRLLMMPQV